MNSSVTREAEVVFSCSVMTSSSLIGGEGKMSLKEVRFFVLTLELQADSRG